jgi:putative hemolysin
VNLGELVLIVVMVLINAFFAASEIAIVSVRKTRIRQLAEDEGSKSARAVMSLTENPSRFLATIQVGVTMAGFFASAIGAVSVVVLVSNLLAGVAIPAIANNATAIALVLVTVLIALVTLIFGELVPKNIALQHSERLALFVARPIEWLAAAAAPLVIALTFITNAILALLGSREKAQVPSVTEDEIRAMMDVAEEEGVMDEEEHDMIEGVFDFGETRVREVMVPRVRIAAIRKDATPRQAWEVIMQTGHSRVPVYEHDLDNMVGVLHAKDLLRYFGGGDTASQVEQLTRPAFFVPSSKLVDELLQELRQTRTHLAIVLDEYGGTAGIVTLEDLLEEIIGPIQDEYDQAEVRDVEQISDDEVVANASASLDDLSDALSVHLEADNVDTVGGLVYTVLGHVPTQGEEIVLPEVIVTVLAVDGPRILRVRVRRVEEERPNEAE